VNTKKMGVLNVAVKDAGTGSGNGEFEAILSAPTLDRDGEVIDAKAFEPLPESIVIHVDHAMGVSTAVARAVPAYEGDLLVAKGYYGSDAESQAVRQKVIDGIITTMSVGFMDAQREIKDGVTHIVKGELLEASFVSVPSNREALVLAAKSARLDEAVATRDYKSLAGSFEERADLLRRAIRDANPNSWWSYVVATFDDAVVYQLDDESTYRAPYSISEGAVTLGSPEPVEVTEVLAPAKSTDPEKAAAPAAAKSPADVAYLLSRRAEAEAASVL
jgi:HK97 family phage prohead protease